MLKCFYDYRYTDEMKKAFDGADRFFPINFKEHWAVVRQVAEALRRHRLLLSGRLAIVARASRPQRPKEAPAP